MDVKIWKRTYCDCVDPISFSAILDDRGRITIPASVRKKLKIRTGSSILTTIERMLRSEDESEEITG